MKRRIFLLTGGRGVGKTTLCQRVLAQARGCTQGGLLTVRVEDEQRDVVDVGSGDRRRLTVSTPGVRQGRYTFDPEVLAWARTVLAQALPCDLLVVDEIGPLEVRRGEGWAGAIELLHGGGYRLALVVVRPELVTEVQRLLSPSALTVVTVTPENRDRLVDVLLDKLPGSR